MKHKAQRHDPLKNLVGFLVGDVHYALPIACVREIANPLEVVELPRAAVSVAGVAEYRGDVVPVVELRTRFGLPAAPSTRRTKWILIDVGGRAVALVVDGVTDVFGAGGGDLHAPPTLGGGEDVRRISGVTSHGGKLVFVLETAHFGALTAPLLAAGSIGPRPRSLT